MPTAGRPRSSTLDHATRQQLDELDALMQRMLALPVNPPEDAPNPPRQGIADCNLEIAPPPVPEPSSPIQDAQTRVEDDAAGTEAGPPFPSTTLAPLTPSAQAMESLGDSSRTRLAPVSGVFAGLDPPRIVKVKLARSAGMPEARTNAPPVAWPLRPLLWLNLAFDLGTAWLGPPGRWLRGPGGRSLLGWGGLLLLTAALAWIALDEMGWTW